MYAGALSCFGGNGVRVDRLDRRIRAAIPYFIDESQQPTWEIWRYLMARSWFSLKLRSRKLSEHALAEADRALGKLLQQPVSINPRRPRPWSAYSDDVYQPDSVPTLNGLLFGIGFSGGKFPSTAFLKSRGDLGGVATPLLYRSILEYIARARSHVSDGSIADAQASYAIAADIAGELSKRLPNSGAFLEFAVLRAEARFLQGHQLDPVRALQLTKRADLLLVAATCDKVIRSAQREAPQTLVASDQSFEKETFLGPIPLLCPFELQRSLATGSGGD